MQRQKREVSVSDLSVKAKCFWLRVFPDLTSEFCQETLNLDGCYEGRVNKHGLNLEMFPVVTSLRTNDFSLSESP
jgi:hypothetical protein